MGLTKNNPEKGNMYEFVTLMYSPIRGKCKHECSYCYVVDTANRYNAPLKDLFLDEKDLRKKLGTGETVFVCYTCDLFACLLLNSRLLETFTCESRFEPEG